MSPQKLYLQINFCKQKLYLNLTMQESNNRKANFITSDKPFQIIRHHIQSFSTGHKTWSSSRYNTSIYLMKISWAVKNEAKQEERKVTIKVKLQYIYTYIYTHIHI